MFRFASLLISVFSISISFAQVDCLGVPHPMGNAWPGTPCDDNDSATGNDVFLADCTCEGELIDCIGAVGGIVLPGTPCNDGDAYTTIDTWTASCNCVGVWTDCNGVLNGPDIPGTPCDDGDPNTQNDEWNWNCSCGTSNLIDCLGVPNGPTMPGTPCDDNDPTTGNDVWNSICQCQGETIDCYGVPGGFVYPGFPCDDGDPSTINDVINADCTCGANGLFSCDGDPQGTAFPGTGCNDNDPLTNNDLWDSNCNCVGDFFDCLGMVNGTALIGSICDDGDPNTLNDKWQPGCICVGDSVDCLGFVQGPTVIGTLCDDGNPLTFNDSWNTNCQCRGLSNTIMARVFRDANGNQNWDSFEPIVPNRVVELTSSNGIILSAQTNANGIVYLRTDTGDYYLSAPPSPYDSMSIAPIFIQLASYGNWVTQFVPLEYSTSVVDLALNAFIYNQPRPGFVNSTFLTVRNIGSLPSNGILSFVVDWNQSFYQSTSSPGAVLTGDTVTWLIDTLQPGQSTTRLLNMLTDSSAFLGSSVDFDACVSTVQDVDTTNNCRKYNLTIVGSWDPNDKLVAPAVLEPVQGASGIELQYRIRFQNTGTFYAENVRVEDMLPPELDASTFEFIESSHQCQWQNDNGNLTFYFNQIFLPDSNTNEPQSHGHILFSIDTYPGLMPGDSISNSASIFFDFNAPVITNLAITRVAIPTTISQVERDEELVVVWPNPAKNQLNVTFNTSVYGDANFVLYDIAGKQVAQHVLEAGSRNAQVALGNLESSIYYYTITAKESIIGQGKLSVVR